MTLVEKVFEDLPKDADTLRHVQEWVNSAVTDETDGAESEDQRDHHRDRDWRSSSLPVEDRWAQKGADSLIRTRLDPTPNLGTGPTHMMRPRDTTERGRQLITAGPPHSKRLRIGQGSKRGLLRFQPP